MRNRTLIIVVGLVTFLFLQRAQADQFGLEGVTLYPSSQVPRLLSLDEREQFFFSTSFGWMQPQSDFLPSFNPTRPQSTVVRNIPSSKDTVGSVAELRPLDRVYVGGQIGFLYGRSSGKYGVEYERGYIIGEVGNDKFHFTVGTTYERSNYRTRWGR